MADLQSIIDRLIAESPKVVRGIARDAGIPYATLRKLRAQTTRDPRLGTVERLRSYYAQRDREAA